MGMSTDLAPSGHPSRCSRLAGPTRRPGPCGRRRGRGICGADSPSRHAAAVGAVDASRARAAARRATGRTRRHVGVRRRGPRRICDRVILNGSGCLVGQLDRPANRTGHARPAPRRAELSTRRLSSSLSIRSAPRAREPSSSCARAPVRQRSHMPPSTKLRDRRAKRRLGSHLRKRIRPVFIDGHACHRRLRGILGRPVGGLEPRDLARTGYDWRDSRSALPTRSRAARERGSNVVQGSG